MNLKQINAEIIELKKRKDEYVENTNDDYEYFRERVEMFDDNLWELKHIKMQLL